MAFLTWIKTKLTSIYHKIRALLFAFVYPAPDLFNPKQESFMQLHKSFKSHRLLHKNQLDPAFDAKSGSAIKNDNGYRLVQATYGLNADVRIDAIENAKKNYDKKYFDAVIITNSPYAIFNPERQYIILINDCDSCYEKNIDELLEIAMDNDSNVISFNPMGVGMSPGTANDLKDYQDVIKSIIDNMTRQNITHEKIVLLGKGFGGAMAIAVAAQYHQQGIKIKVISDRAFAKLDEFIGIKTQNIFPWLLRSTLGRIGFYFAKTMARLFGADLDAAFDFATINQKHPGYAWGLQAKSDQVIPETYDLAHGLSKELREKFIVRFYDKYDQYDDMDNDAHVARLNSLYDKSHTHRNKAMASMTAKEYINYYLNSFKKIPKANPIKKSFEERNPLLSSTLDIQELEQIRSMEFSRELREKSVRDYFKNIIDDNSSRPIILTKQTSTNLSVLKCP